MIQFDKKSQAIARRLFLALVLINALLIAVLLAGAVTSYLMGPFEEKVTESGEKLLGGPKKPGRFVSSLPPIFRVALFQLDADKEGNLATVITSLNFFAAGYLFIALGKRLRNEKKLRAALWALLGVGLMLVGVEEVFSTHSILDRSEPAGEETLQLLDSIPGAELLFFLAPLAAGGLLIVYLVYKTFSSYKKSRIIAYIAVCMWLIAVVIDTTLHGLPSHVYRMISLIEEGFEIVGALMLVYATYMTLFSFHQHQKESEKAVQSQQQA